jgi:hypothetical protein
MKLSKIYKSLLQENNSLDSSTEKELQKIGKELSNNEKIKSMVLSAFAKNPKAFDVLDKKVGKLLPTNEATSDFDINFNNLEKLSLDLSKDIDVEITESLKDTLKIATRVLKLLGLSSLDDIIITIVKEVAQGQFFDTISVEHSGTLNSIAFIITIATIVLKIIREAKRRNLKATN